VRKVVAIGDFVGIVAEREDQAEAAMHALAVQWKPWPALPPLDDLAQAIRANPSTPRVVASQGDVDAARAASTTALDREYVWPYQMHASLGPSCAVADWRGDTLTVWAGTQNPHVLRADLAKLTGLADTAVNVVRLEASGCYGRNSADDVAADAALLSRAVNAPVRVQLTREQEHAWEPKGAAQLMRVRGGLDAHGDPIAYDFDTSYPSNAAPTLALLLTRAVEPVARVFEMGDRTAVPPYAYANQRITVNDMAPMLRASWLRGVSALPNSFAHESYIDELAHAAGVDPVEYRLRHLKDDRAAELVRAVAHKAGWRVHTKPQQQGADGDWLKGQGFAYARYVHSKFPGFGAAWAAWVADVDVHRVTGDVHVRRVVVGQDAGMMVNPAGVQHQVHGNVIQTTSRALKERVSVDPQTRAVAAQEWGSYPILSFREVPVVEVLLMPRPDEPPLGVGESSSVPGTAAIANAIFDATGVRFRQPPFTPEVVRAAINPLPAPPAPAPPPADVVRARVRDPQRARKGLLATIGAFAAASVGVLGAAFGWRPAIAPVQLSARQIYSTDVIERGRQLAALGNCVHCHTADGGAALAGGRAVETPFGTVVSTNITPDVEHGVGRWSFSAFQRAMREGIARDGRHLYPVFPYPSFTQASDDDLQAIYAWLMAQPAVSSTPPASELRFPFNLRPLMAWWNALHLQSGPLPVDAAPSALTSNSAPTALWNRGAYLVNGLGHCGACHTERDALGAERKTSAYLGGAVAQGWEAPALGALSQSPLPWTEDQLVRYLQRGHDTLHGMAGGPMTPVVRGLAQLPIDDVRAIAHYLVSLQSDRAAPDAATLVARSREQGATLRGPAQRMFESACGACHHDGDGPELTGLNAPLALNPNLHSARPDNLLRTILDGIQDPAVIEIGHMPAFRHALNDAQIAELAAYMRQRFAPGQPPWQDLAGAVARARAQH
jgi:nicotinate dehydrogenase subunit B